MVIIVFGGRRVDAADAATPRFPSASEGLVRERLREIFERYQPEVVVASAAAGADLLALEEAGARGARRRVLLPFEPERFRTTSVVDRPGEWGLRYDQVRAEVEPGGDFVVHPTTSEDERDEEAYLRVVHALLDEAMALAAQEGATGGGAAQVVAVAAWDGVSRGEDDMTAAFIEEARRRGIAVEEVATL